MSISIRSLFVCPFCADPFKQTAPICFFSHQHMSLMQVLWRHMSFKFALINKSAKIELISFFYISAILTNVPWFHRSCCGDMLRQFSIDCFQKIRRAELMAWIILNMKFADNKVINFLFENRSNIKTSSNL